MRAPRPVGRRGALVVGVALTVSACAGIDAKLPTATLAHSPAAEHEMQGLVASWARSSRAERVALEPALTTFRQRHADDEVSRLADTFLAWIALDKGAAQAAELQARRVRLAAGPGTVADLCQTIEGAALRRTGRPAAALELLQPLVSKLIDPWARALLNREAVASAVDAGRWSRALTLMRVWLREAAPEERASARAAVEQGLSSAPTAELLQLLDEGPATAVGDEEVELRKLVAQRLAFVARAANDALLAQRLLERAGGVLGDQGDVVAQLAAGANRARVEARTVGLLLSLRDDATRRRGAEIAKGAAFGLGLPGSNARLVSRDDHGSKDRIEEALAALSADGASILIAGNDLQEANAAADFAEAHRIPVLLLRPPTTAHGGAYTFNVGADRGDLEAALVAGLAARGVAPISVLSDDPSRDAAAGAVVLGCAEPTASWRAAGLGGGVGGLVLLAEAVCAREALTATTSLRPRVAAGLEYEALPLPPASLTATAGAFPLLPSSPQLRGWLKDHATTPSWWAALARDAAILAWAGVQGLPVQGTEEPGEVEARRAKARASLATARAELWTTTAPGFGGARTLPRTFGVRELANAPTPGPG